MEAWKFFKLSCFLVRYIEARGVLSSGSFDALGDIFWGGLQAIEHEGLLSCFGWLEVARHGLSSTRRRDMRSAWTYDNGGGNVIAGPAGG